MKRYTKFLILFLLLEILVTACQKEFNKYSKISMTKWKPTLSLPIAKTTITFRDIIGNNSSIITNADSSLVYVYHQDSVISISADSLMQLSPQLSQQYTFSLGIIHFDDFSDSSKITIDDLLSYLDTQTANAIRNFNGTQNIFPPVKLSRSYTRDMPDMNNFNNLKFSSGSIEIKASNELPFSIDTIAYDLVDVKHNSIIKTIHIYNLGAGASETETIQLAGITIGNSFRIITHSISSKGSYPDKVLIDLSKGVSFTFSTQNLSVVSGDGIISQQVAISKNKILNITTQHDERLYLASIEQGSLEYTVNSNLNVDINGELVFPTVLKENHPLDRKFSIPANNSITNSWDLSGTGLDFRTDSTQKYNRLPVNFRVSLAPSNQLISFDSSNKVTATFSIDNIKLSAVQGYLGKQQYKIASNGLPLDLDFLNKIKGSLLFTNPRVIFHYRNDFGIPIRTKINLDAIKKESGKAQTLNFDSVSFKYPLTEGQTVYDSIEIDKNNSSIVDFMSLLPDSINYSGGFTTNPAGPAINFIHNTDKFTADADIKFPFSFQTKGITFDDTVQGFHISPDDIPADSGTIVAGISNGLPFDIGIKLIFPDSTSGAILRTINVGTIHSASVNNSGSENTPKKSILNIHVPSGFFDDIQKANIMLVHLDVATYNQGTVPVQVFANDEVKIALGIRAKFTP